MKKEIEIKNAVSISWDGSTVRVVCDEIQYTPESGDICVWNESHIEKNGPNKFPIIGIYGKDGEMVGLNMCGNLVYSLGYGDSAYRPATDIEKQKLFDVLAQEGKKWNEATRKIEPLRWRAKLHGAYKIVDLSSIGANVGIVYDECRFVDNSRYQSNNYFNPDSSDAEKVAEDINKLFISLKLC